MKMTERKSELVNVKIDLNFITNGNINKQF